MFPNNSLNLSQFYSVPSSAHPHHAYPYSLCIQPNPAMNIVSQTQKNTPASCLGDLLTNGSSTSRLGTKSGASFKECYPQHRVQESEVVSLPKYFRCSLGEEPTRYRRERTVFTQNQLRVFEKRFETQKYLSTQERFELARNLGLSPLQVKTWFQNRRMKWKKTTKGQPSQNAKANEIMKEKSQPANGKTANNQL